MVPGRRRLRDRYGCPFLYAECRIYYGSVLAAKGRWDDAERELNTGVRITDGACPGLHSRALARLAALRLRQGRLEEAEGLLAGMGGDIEAEAEASVLAAAVSLARGDASAAARRLEQRLRHLQDHRLHLGGALDLLVDAYLEAGRLDAAAGAAARLAATAAAASSRQLAALAACARGRVALARGDGAAVADLEAALKLWSSLELPLEVARTRFELARALAASEPDAAIEHARLALAGFEEPRRGPGGRPGRRVPPLGGSRAPHRSQGDGNADRAGAGGARAAGGGTVQPRDRRAPAHQPQDGVPSRQQHPGQAGAAEPGRGCRPRGPHARCGGRDVGSPDLRADK